MSSTPGLEGIALALAAPFLDHEVQMKPQTISGNRALVVRFVDARAVQDRLDAVLGVLGWQDAYEVLPDGNVVCRLSVKAGDEWITKEDVGGMSEQPDEGDRRKAAFSDALKRAAVKFGVGRYLYREKPVWMDYDPVKKRIARGVAPPRPPAPGTKLLHRRLADLSAAADAAGLAPPMRGTVLLDTVAQFCPYYGQDPARWPEDAAAAVLKFAKERYVAVVGPLPAPAEEVAKLKALADRKGQPLSAVSAKVGLGKELTRAGCAAARTFLEALPDQGVGGQAPRPQPVGR